MTPAWSTSTGFFNTTLKFTIIIMFRFLHSTNCYECSPACRGPTFCNFPENKPRCSLCRSEGSGCGRTGVPCCPDLRCSARSRDMKCEKYEGRKAGQVCDSYNYCVPELDCIFHKCTEPGKMECKYGKLGEHCDHTIGMCCNEKEGFVCLRKKCMRYLKEGEACSADILKTQFMFCPPSKALLCKSGTCHKSEKLAKISNFQTMSPFSVLDCPCKQ